MVLRRRGHGAGVGMHIGQIYGALRTEITGAPVSPLTTNREVTYWKYGTLHRRYLPLSEHVDRNTQYFPKEEVKESKKGPSGQLMLQLIDRREVCNTELLIRRKTPSNKKGECDLRKPHPCRYRYA